MNRIQRKIKDKKKILSIYFTAGYPNIGDTATLIEHLEASGVDMIEIGLPFSDPLADGTTIQESSAIALKNGMTTNKFFDQLLNIRQKVTIPLLVMGYFNPMMQYGIGAFCKTCKEVGIDALIIPDLPIDIYHKQYETLFKSHDMANIFLVTPQTSNKRIQFIDSISDNFIYLVSSTSTTGPKDSFDQNTLNYFQRIEIMNLKNPQLIGFGVSNAKTFSQATTYSKGAIIGSSFINHITQHGTDLNSVRLFIKKILTP